MRKVEEHANWNMKARLLKYHEDIDSFAHRTTWWAKSLRRLSTIWLISFLASALYDKTVGRLERKFHALFTPYQVIEMEGNCLLNTGIDKIWDLVTGVVSGTGHIYDGPAGGDKAQIGVGDSATAANATQTDLLAATNKTYKTMEAGYPTSTTQKATFKSSFGSGDANYVWNEWVVKQVTSAVCLNRKVESLGTKSTGTWTLLQQMGAFARNCNRITGLIRGKLNLLRHANPELNWKNIFHKCVETIYPAPFVGGEIVQAQ